MSAARPLSPTVARAAAAWFVRLEGCTEDGGMDEATRAAWLRWRAADPEHERAWQRAERVRQQLGTLPEAVAAPVLGRPQGLSRRQWLRGAGGAALVLPLGYLAWQAQPWSSWSADYSTAPGEWREWSLADGTRLVLNTNSAVDVRFDATQREIVLHAGEILVETGPDLLAGHRPLHVRTARGQVRALGTRFLVREHEGMTWVQVYEGAVAMEPRRGAASSLRLQAGERGRFDVLHAEARGAARLADAQWQHGVLAVDGMPLSELIAVLGRYRRGWLRCDPAVAGLRISGAYQLADTDAILRSLPEVLPVGLVWRSAYWVKVVPARG